MDIPGIETSHLGVLLIDAQVGFWEGAFGDDEEGPERVMVRLEHLLMLAGRNCP